MSCVNDAPSLVVGVPAQLELATLNGMPVASKYFKTGQTLLKTVVAPGPPARGVRGWFLTNIPGNLDGLVFDALDNFCSEEVSKPSVPEYISISQPTPNWRFVFCTK